MKQVYSQETLPQVARDLIAEIPLYEDKATILALSGPLGAGKTSLTQAIARELGIAESVVSPTFVIAKWYAPTRGDFGSIVHIDAYRIEDEGELGPLGFAQLCIKPKTLVIIEWPERLPKTLSTIPIQLYTMEHHGEERSIEGPLPSYERTN